VVGSSSTAGWRRVATPRGGRPRLDSSNGVAACPAVSAARRAADRPPGSPASTARPPGPACPPGPASSAGLLGAPASVSGPFVPGRPAPASVPGATPGPAASTAAAPSPAAPSPAAPSPMTPSPAASAPSPLARRPATPDLVAFGPVAFGPVAPVPGPVSPIPGPLAVPGRVAPARRRPLAARSPKPGAGLPAACPRRGPKVWPLGAPPEASAAGARPASAVRGRSEARSSACEPQSRPVCRVAEGPGDGSSSITAQVWVAVRSAAASLSARAEYPGSASLSVVPRAPPAVPSHAARVEARFHEEYWPGG
jgi:hypothetical protein